MRTPDWFSDIRFAFSFKGDGQMSLKRAQPSVVAHNRRKFLEARGLQIESVVAGELVHGSKVASVTVADAGRGAFAANWIPGVDGLVTADPDVLLMTTHADCAPVVIYDPQHRVLGQAHAGWRSLRAGLIEQLVRAVRTCNGVKPTVLKAWIGPTVRVCCYPVGPDVALQFPEECQVLIGGARRLDIVRFIMMELARLDFDPAGVVDSGVCTACEPEFSSFRRDGAETAAMALVTGL